LFELVFSAEAYPEDSRSLRSVVCPLDTESASQRKELPLARGHRREAAAEPQDQPFQLILGEALRAAALGIATRAAHPTGSAGSATLRNGDA